MKHSDASHQKIFATIRAIPPGRVASYGQLAEIAGLPGRARLVGRLLKTSCADEPLPWHRVLRSNGEIAFDEHSEAASVQRQRLRAEGVEVNGNRIAMKQYRWQPGLEDLFRLEQLNGPC